MKAKNLLIIMSDQHSRGMLGCYGDPIVRTLVRSEMGGSIELAPVPGGGRGAQATIRVPV